MAINGVGVVSAIAGSLLLYSAIEGKNFSETIRSILAGQPPSKADAANPISAPIANPIPVTQEGGGNTGLPYGTVGGGGVTSPSGPGESAWIRAFLTSIGAPSTQANINSISSWIAHEGPYGTQGENNPLNTTIETAGYTGKFAGTPVSNFSSVSDGIAALVATIRGSAYSDVLQALQSGKGLCGQSWAGLATWSGGGYSQVC